MKMKAAVYSRYGPPEVVSLDEIDVPQPNDNEVLVKVHATTVNRTDCGFRSAEYFVSRFFSGLIRPKYNVLGNEFAGIIHAAGKDVTTFRIGERVFGYNDFCFGAHAQYMLMSEKDAIAPAPDNLELWETSALTEGVHYALSNIRAARVQAGQHVMVYGATGAIGSAAVQLLKYFGATVTAVCDTKNIDLVRSLGADFIIDYTKTNYAVTDKIFDFVFDAVGKISFDRAKPILAKKGIYISTELGKNCENIRLALTTPLAGGKKVLFPIPDITQKDVFFIKDLVEMGKLRPVIDRIYPLEQIVEAYKYVETGQKIGNVIIKLE
jgi:NADPH:quinone reductase-like Zn-dependent oxidoreductase